MFRALLILIALATASCAGPTVVTGPYAHRLSSQDIHEIKMILGPGLELSGASYRIHVSRPDYAVVDCRLEASRESDKVREQHFDVAKRSGRWIAADPNQFIQIGTGYVPLEEQPNHL